MDYYLNWFTVGITVLNWFWAFSWSKKDIFNLIVKFIFLICALIGSFFVLHFFGFVVKV